LWLLLMIQRKKKAAVCEYLNATERICS
jgi:hypothetical protein